MSKLIVEMEMPKSCPCELATEIEGNFYPCFAYYGVVERAVEFDKCMRDGNRPDWCPIKGVLPDEHGDLIDRDELKKMKVYSPERHEYIVPLAYVDWQDTVNAAERKKSV
ncbi:MAG: hypothetical protein IIY21_27970 [Clostridiales bacterium]|nr:hypothetical protein [Clostridiales bacterium]MBQ1570211.1 hypothetical protein [Clostridiales bacterium]